MTLPTLTVLLDDGTGTFPLNITSKVMALDGYEISRGRSDWIGAVTAGELGLTLNNSDGRFTPGSTILGTPSPIKVDQQIRVVESFGGFGTLPFGMGPFGGSINRFTGYVKSWPVSWPAVVPTFSEVQITATDAQARSERRTLKSMLEEEILLDSPTAYYTLSEAEGSTSAGDTSGNQAPVLTMAGTGAAVTFGSGTGPTDGLTAATFAGGQYLSCSTTALSMTGSWSAVALYSTTSAPGVGFRAEIVNVHFGAAGSSNDIALGVNNAGRVSFAGPVSGGGQSANAVTDGLTHWAIITFDGTNLSLYDDGVLDATVAALPAPTAATSVSVGGAPSGAEVPFTGVISHVALFDGVALSPTQVASISGALSGTETSTARLARLASYAGIPVGTLDSSLTTVPAQATSGTSAQDAIQAVIDAELGLAFIDGNGDLTFHNRDRVPVKTAPDLILDSQYVTPDVQPMTDDQQIVNYFEATAAGTGATMVARVAASEDAHGRYPVSQTYLVTSDDEALSRANWIVNKFAEPSARYGTLTINLFKMSDVLAAITVAALDLNCWLRVTSMASQNPGGTVADVVVQGFRAVATGDSWEIVCNVVSRSLYQTALWDDSGSLWDSAVWSV